MGVNCVESAQLRAAQANLSFAQLVLANKVERSEPTFPSLLGRRASTESWVGEPLAFAQIDLDRAISDIAEENGPVVRHLTFQRCLREGLHNPGGHGPM